MIVKTKIIPLYRQPVEGDLAKYKLERERPFYVFFNKIEHNAAFFVPQQLLVLSDKTPNKLGDWYLDDTDAIRQTVTEDEEYWKARPDYKKIIAAYPAFPGTYSQMHKDLCPITTGECSDNTECLAYGIKNCKLSVAKIDPKFIGKYIFAGCPELINVKQSHHFKTDEPPIHDLTLDINDCIIANIVIPNKTNGDDKTIEEAKEIWDAGYKRALVDLKWLKDENVLSKEEYFKEFQKNTKHNGNQTQN